jgi:hypothetical protein
MKISNFIKRLQHIQDNEGDLVMYKLDDGIPKMVENVEVIQSADGRKICILSL